MTQTPVNFVAPGTSIPHTPDAAVVGGQVIEIGGFIVVAKGDIAAGAPGAVAIDGIFDGPKPDGLDIDIGAALFWDNDGNPSGGDAGSGCLTNSDGSGNFAGWCIAAAAADAATVRFRLQAFAGMLPSIGSEDALGL